MENNLSDASQDEQKPKSEGEMHLSHSEGRTIQPLAVSDSEGPDIPAPTPSAPPDNPTPPTPDPAPTPPPVQDSNFMSAPIEPNQPGAIITGDFSPAQPSVPTTSPIASNFNQVPPASTAPQPASMPAAASGNSPKSSKYKKFSKYGLMIFGVLIVLGGASAAAFYGIIRPHEPAYVLRSALINTVKQNSYDFNSNINASYSDTVVKLNLSGGVNRQSKSGIFNVNFDVSGVKVTAQAKYVNQNLYFKFGDLSTIVALLKGFDPSVGPLAQQVSTLVSNQWIIVDSALLDEAGINCLTGINPNITNSEIQSLENLYNQHQFTTIKSTTNTTLNGQPAEEFNLAINDNKGAAFLNGLDNMAQIKSAEACANKNQSGYTYSTQNTTGDGKTRNIQLWINKKTKLLEQFSAKFNGDGTNGTVTLGLNYQPVNVKAPTSSTQVLKVVGEIEQDINDSTSTTGLSLGNLFGSSSDSGSSSTLQGTTNFLSN